MLDPGLTIEESWQDGLPVLSLRGEADVLTAPLLRHALADATERFRVVVLDLSGVTFLDSTALSVLVVARRGLTIRITGLRPHVRKVFDVTGLSDSFSVYGDRTAFGDGRVRSDSPERSDAGVNPQRHPLVFPRGDA